MRSLVAVLLAVSLLAGCVTRDGGSPEGEPEQPTRPVELAVPIELRPVLATESRMPLRTRATTFTRSPTRCHATPHTSGAVLTR